MAARASPERVVVGSVVEDSEPEGAAAKAKGEAERTAEGMREMEKAETVMERSAETPARAAAAEEVATERALARRRLRYMNLSGNGAARAAASVAAGAEARLTAARAWWVAATVMAGMETQARPEWRGKVVRPTPGMGGRTASRQPKARAAAARKGVAVATMKTAAAVEAN